MYFAQYEGIISLWGEHYVRCLVRVRQGGVLDVGNSILARSLRWGVFISYQETSLPYYVHSVRWLVTRIMGTLSKLLLNDINAECMRVISYWNHAFSESWNKKFASNLLSLLVVTCLMHKAEADCCHTGLGSTLGVLHSIKEFVYIKQYRYTKRKQDNVLA